MRRCELIPIGDADGSQLFASYHCSRYNTSTRVLTPANVPRCVCASAGAPRRAGV